MSALSRWLSRIVGRALTRHDSVSPIGQMAREQFRIELLREPRYADPARLCRFEHQVFSQGGEDGILREIFRRVGETDRVFVELGVGDGFENNTLFLLSHGWSGVWLDGDRAGCASIRKNCAREIADGRLDLVEAAATAENIVSLLPERIRTAGFDLLSIDLDRNTYHVWAALEDLAPRVVVVEYNAMYPADLAWIAEYDPGKWWNGSSYYGASLKALEILGARMGYALVGCDIAGVNAFFVRRDLCADRFRAPFTAENHFEPMRYYLHGRVGHPRALHD